jgi:hypothetical protein
MTIMTPDPVILELRDRLDAGEQPAALVEELMLRFNIDDEEAWFWLGLAGGNVGDLRLSDPPPELRELEDQWRKRS